MCEYCKTPFCFGACPTKDGDEKKLILGLLGICFWCGSKIYLGNPFQFKNGNFYCGECATKAHLPLRFT